ncbi:MAG: Spi family protease inhibitor [Bacteroidales bacterium]
MGLHPFVGLSVVKGIASDIYFPNDDNSSLKSTEHQTKSVLSIDEIKNTSGETLFYIINYYEGGFILLASDKRAIPVLAYSTDNNFEVDEYSYPPGVKVWMDDAKKQIESIKSSGSEQSRIAKKSWASIQQAIIGEVSSLKKEPIPDCYELTEIITNGPIVVPTWDQEHPYNSELPTITCPDSTHHCFVGCVPLAMAMVMRYHEHPTSYSWSSMPYTYGTSTTAAYT